MQWQRMNPAAFVFMTFMLSLVLLSSASLYAQQTPTAEAIEPIQAPAATDESQVLTFRAPYQGPFTDYVKELIELAYANMGYRLNYVEMPRSRSLTEANEGRLAGELGRVPEIAEEFPNLIRVEFPVFSFELVLVARRKNCGACSLSQVQNFAYINGMRSVEAVIREHDYQGETVALNDIDQLHQMFTSGRVDAVLINDFEARELGYFDDRHLIANPMLQSNGYHYLHNQYRTLVPFLERELYALHDAGVLGDLLRKHNVVMAPPHGELPDSAVPTLEVAAGYQPGLLNADGTGQYWQVLEQVLTPMTESLNLRTYTHQKAIAGFIEGRHDILVGVYAGHQPAESLVSRVHFAYDQPRYLFALDSDMLAQTKAGESNRPICYASGYGVREFLPNTINFYRADTAFDCFNLLNMKRVAGVIAYANEQPASIRQTYYLEQLHDSLPLHLAFQNNLTGRKLKRWFDARMRELNEAGQVNLLPVEADALSSK